MTFRPLRPCTIVASLLIAAGTAAAGDGFPPGSAADNNLRESTADPAPTIVLSPCTLPDVAQAARCGVLVVPENPDRPDGRQLSIGVAVVPASGGQALSDPIVPLMGGPGEDAISAAALYADQFASLHRDRDLLLVDQRGTGRSGALRCGLHSAGEPAPNLRDFFPPAAVTRCERRLRTRADLTQYTYAHFASDLERVRKALGYGRLNLFAGSYGTRAAQVYLRAYPNSVRTAYLGSVVPIDVVTPLVMAKTAQEALEDTFSACAADSACRAAFPDLRDEFARILARLDAGEVRAILPGRTGTVPMQRGRVVEWFRSLLYRPKSAARLPWLIHQAHEGDWSPIVEGILSQAQGMDSAISLGLFFSITCAEDMAFLDEKDIVAQSRDTALGDYRVRQQQVACKPWPKASLPAEYRTPVRSSVPVMFVSGDIDGGSPLWFTDRVAKGFSDRVQVVQGGRGHTQWTECVGQLYERFVRTGATRGLDGSSCKAMPRPPFETRRGNGP
ncbi:alpha/beta hydrolase [Luteimonas suaedae]|uniref:alpha/beta hydrolase n=1 Tax=Luteimonas suaedae TaxID=2605430 RepID=UPI00165A0F39|nr:alpha/beta fold hydrolase [Luteimonas suaedae]